jgi:DNA-binding MarR family transcriptional regulator
VKQQRQGGFLIGRIHQAARRVFAALLVRHGIRLNPQQGRVLFVLWREGALPMGEIARRTSLGKSTLTSMIDRLERDGHLRRVSSGEDGRVVLIEPTARDAASQRQYVAASREMTALFYRGFSPTEIDRFEADLARILDNLTRARSRRSGGVRD